MIKFYSLSARILHRAPPPPAPSGLKFSNSKNCYGSENAMPPKSFGLWRVTEAILSQKTWFFFKKHNLEKIHNKSHYFLKILDMHFLDTNAVILKNQKYLQKSVCIYRENNPNGEFLSIFLQVSKFVLH